HQRDISRSRGGRSLTQPDPKRKTLGRVCHIPADGVRARQEPGQLVES
ncbi:hypothetical protein GA0115259_100521, partial [Streptomyces sp. MnatMP-M17]